MKLIPICLGLCALSLGAWAAPAANAPVKNEVKFTGTYYLPDQLGTRPVIIKQAQPRFPSDLSRDGIGGQVEIAFIVNEKGMPEEVQVATATNASYGEAAIVAVKQWRFKAGIKDGVPVRTAILQKIEFEFGR